MKTKRRQKKLQSIIFGFLAVISGALMGCENNETSPPQTETTQPTTPPIQRQTYLPDDVVLHEWHFEDAIDSLGSGVVTGNRSYNTGGNIEFIPSELGLGYTAVFDGASGIYLGSDIISSHTYTISIWVKPKVITEFSPILWASNEEPFQWISMLPNAWWGGTGVWLYGPWQDLDPNRMHHMVVGEWNHFVLTVENGFAIVYLNNQIIARNDDINNVFSRGGSRIYLGVNRWDTPFEGLIDSVMIYENAALTPSGVAALFNHELPLTTHFIVPEYVDLSAWIKPGANRTTPDAATPVFQNATVHDPAMTRFPISREDGDWYYIIGTFLGAARTQDFVQFQSIDYGRGYPNLRNTTNHRFMPVDNPEPSVMTFEEQVRSVVSDGGGSPARRTDGAFMPGTYDNLVIWASDIIEVPNTDGNGSRFFQYYSFSHWGVPDSAIGLAIADTIDGPWITQGLLLKTRHANNNQAMDGTPFIRHFHPNAIDPYPIISSDGRFWLVYGSWEGGIFIVELDIQTGMLLEGSAINEENNGYGRNLIASNSNEIEGAHMIFSETSGMYYLFASWGSLASYNGYNVRMFRSPNPYGPFEDARFRQLNSSVSMVNGLDRIDITGEIFHHINDSGVKIIGGYRFVGAPIEDSLGLGYLSPGHGSMSWDSVNERYMKIFHTRFIGRGEIHQIRAHEMFMNEHDWFVMAPLRFSGVDSAVSQQMHELVGDYKILSHGRGTNRAATLSEIYRLNEHGQILNNQSEQVGTWQLTGDFTAHIDFYGITYNGVFLRQFCDDTRRWVQTFTVLSYDERFMDENDITTHRGSSSAGISLWGVGISNGLPFTQTEE